MLPAVALVVPLMVVTRLPDSAPVPEVWQDASWRPARFMPPDTCEGDGFCPPPAALARVARSQVPAEAVFAVDAEERFPSSMFMPQQMDLWPGDAGGLLDAETLLFPTYTKHFQRSMRRYQRQPFFNDLETPEERRAFLADLAITHVLVNPRHHALMTRVRGAAPDLWRVRYDDGRWALYEVVRPAGHVAWVPGVHRVRGASRYST
jgi:hypothetical protein